MTSAPIAAVILAGGDGGRIGVPKLTLRLGGRTYLEHIVWALSDAGIAPVAAVVHTQFSEWAATVLPGAMIVTIADPEAPMFESLRAGLGRLDQQHTTVVVPVDHPHVDVETYRRLAETAKAHPDAIVKPAFRGSSGHPIVLPPQVVRLVLAAAPGRTLRDVMGSSGVRQVIVAVEDEGVLKNVNTPKDLREGEGR